jgi:hypothetical protein
MGQVAVLAALEGSSKAEPAWFQLDVSERQSRAGTQSAITRNHREPSNGQVDY